MTRTFSWIAASVTLASAQVVPEASKDGGAPPIPVEASVAIRESLAVCSNPRILEVLPDPMKYPELHAEELEGTRQSYGLVSKVAGHACYPVDPEYSEELVQPLLNALSASESLRVSKSCERFWPEKMISWGKGDEIRRVGLSVRTKEVVFFDGEKKMRYGLTDGAVKLLKMSAAGDRIMRPDAMEEAVPVLDALKEGGPIAIHEGLPRLPTAAAEASLKRRGELLMGGYQFLKSGTVDRNTQDLRDLLVKEGALATWGGRSACGGFHPDFAITWQIAKQEVALLICFGCHEVIIRQPDGTLIYDLPKASYDALKNELEKFRPQFVPNDK